MLTRPPRAVTLPAFTEHVLPALAAWRGEGRRTALVTLVGIEGGGPRPLGAQMAIADDGRALGHISGGCLEAAMVQEAAAAMAERRNRLVRYGAGSPYMDIRLPCGSGLDIYIDQTLDDATLAEALALAEARQPFSLRTDLASERTVLAGPAPTALTDGVFTRGYAPALRLLAIGAGPLVATLARLAAEIDAACIVYTPDAALLAAPDGLDIRALTGDAPALPIDAATAVCLLFHDHDWEAAILALLVASPAFYIGALGSERAHAARLAALAARGIAADALARITGPAGLIPRAKSPTVIALSMLAQVVAEGAARGIAP